MAGERTEMNRNDASVSPAGGAHIDADGAREASVSELQRRLDQKRSEIGHKVSEIKTTMTTEYANTKSKIHDTLDWRLQMQRYPMAACLGALAVGFVAGKMLGHQVMSGSSGSSRNRGRSMNIGAGSALAPTASLSSSTPMSSGGGDHGGMGSRMSSMLHSAANTKVVGRVEDVLNEVAEHFLGEISRVGRELVVPTVIGSLTNAFQNARNISAGGHTSSSSSSPSMSSSGSRSGGGADWSGRGI